MQLRRLAALQLCSETWGSTRDIEANKSQSFAFHRPSSLWIAQIFVDQAFAVPQILVFSSIVYWATNLYRSAGAFFIFFLMILSGNVSSEALRTPFPQLSLIFIPPSSDPVLPHHRLYQSGLRLRREIRCHHDNSLHHDIWLPDSVSVRAGLAPLDILRQCALSQVTAKKRVTNLGRFSPLLSQA